MKKKKKKWTDITFNFIKNKANLLCRCCIAFFVFNNFHTANMEMAISSYSRSKIAKLSVGNRQHLHRCRQRGCRWRQHWRGTGKGFRIRIVGFVFDVKFCEVKIPDRRKCVVGMRNGCIFISKQEKIITVKQN